MPKQMKKPKRSERETIDAQKPVKRRRKASKELDSAKADQKRNFPMGLDGKEGKAISQFGTDFGMIEKLFPNRTRRLINSKFKAEERMHLSELRDAMSHHSTDHSHFEKVILLLQAQAEEESRQDDAEGDPTTVSQDAADGNEEERDQPEETEQDANGFDGEVDSFEKIDEWDGDDTSAYNEYEAVEWDAGVSSPQNEEKSSEYGQFYRYNTKLCKSFQELQLKKFPSLG